MKNRVARAGLLLAAGLLAAAAVPRKPEGKRIAGEPAAEVRKEFKTVCRGFRAGRNRYYGLAQIEELKTQLAREEGDPQALSERLRP